ncbi:MAG TPA: FAD-binding protein [Methylomirabilota bacterium]|nr:FAD-binding protein [Methylomirabilota bacterium]
MPHNSVEVETDVLVVGAGIAGLRASIEAKKHNARVLIVVKGIYGASGCSLSPSEASAIGPWSDPKDSIDRHLEDMIVGGKQFLCDQELTKTQAQEGAERLLELEKWGLIWDRDPNGKISLFPSSTLGEPGQAPVDRWITLGRVGSRAEGPFWTGHGTVDVLRDEVNRLGIPHVQEAIVSKVLVTDNRVTGAIAYDYLNCKALVIKCPAVIIATGDAGQVYFPHTMVSGEGTGDGYALAYEAGAQLVDMEQFEFMATMHAFPDSARGKAVLENPTEAGEMTYLRNNLGERFMSRYYPETKEASRQDQLGNAMWQEVKAGRGGPHGGVFVDLRHIPRSLAKKSAPGRLESLEKLGFDIETDLIEVFPVVHSTTGGIKIDKSCQTRVNGLFAAGQVAFAVGDCLVEGGTGIVDALVWGKRAGEFSANYSHSTNHREPSSSAVEEEIVLVNAPRDKVSGTPPINFMRRLQHAMWNGASIVKNEKSLLETLNEISDIRKRNHEMCTAIKDGKFNYELREAVEVRHMVTTSEMIVRSSLMRKESRNRFLRSDYPNQDNDWLKHIVIEKTMSGMKLSTSPVEFQYVKPKGMIE